MVVAGLGQAELGEDAADVLFRDAQGATHSGLHNGIQQRLVSLVLDVLPAETIAAAPAATIFRAGQWRNTSKPKERRRSP
ncbi:hypothetical protein [Nonomuraea turcica]|uniref:hypothetical protein n=1 Tax=Nonomuraea sp. G32 TaxID=3067274 RepID=UPI00273AEF62|nr:hypothetical protein [Nonomuraea sp. G32]MDP4506944.1 hypothetical protein [Nonomuraea sp. G32]